MILSQRAYRNFKNILVVKKTKTSESLSVKSDITKIKKSVPTKRIIDTKIYPIGIFEFNEQIAKENIETYIEEIKELPKNLKKVLKQVNKHNKENSYRDEGWTIEQIVHHLADSHMNAFIRFKLALTEYFPTIKPYNQDLFAETSDVFMSSLKSSYHILEGIHKRWAILLENMDTEDFKLGYIHPEDNQKHSLLKVLAMYAWHSKHHIEQIKVALSSESED